MVDCCSFIRVHKNRSLFFVSYKTISRPSLKTTTMTTALRSRRGILGTSSNVSRPVVERGDDGRGEEGVNWSLECGVMD